MTTTNDAAYTVNAPYGVKELGYVYLTALAHEIQQIQSGDPLAEDLPQKEIREKEIRVEWKEDQLRLMGVVRPGRGNKLATYGNAKYFTSRGSYFRRGDFLDMDTVNHLRAPGGTDLYGLAFIDERMRELMGQTNQTWAFLRAMALSTGEIDYTDYETGNTIEADFNVPAANKSWDETDFEGGTKWTHVDADVVTDFQTLLFKMRLMGKNKPTKCVMSAQMQMVLSLNAQVRAHLPGNHTNGLNALGLVTWNDQGLVSSIAGVKITVHEKVYDDYDADGDLVRRYMWPLNKVSFYSTTHPDMPTEYLGKTYITPGEHPQALKGATGVWVRSGWSSDDNLIDPGEAPGVKLQVGMSGLPVLHKPAWLHIVTPCSESDLTDRLGTMYTGSTYATPNSI